MASPVVVSVTTTNSGTGSTTQTATMPGTVNSGDLLIWLAAVDSSGALSAWGGSFTELFDNANSLGRNSRLGCAYKLSSGSESSTYDVTTATSEQNAMAVLRISGAENPSTQVPEYAVNAGSSDTTTPDPPSVTPTGGSDDYLAIAAVGHNNDDFTISAYPSGYSNTNYIKSNGGGGGDQVSLALATKEFTGTSENPGTFTFGSAAQHVAATIVIYPVAAGGGTTGASADTLTLTDATTTIATRLGTVADTLTLTDATTTIATRLGTVADTLTLTDATTTIATRLGTVADTLTFVDAATGLVVPAGAIAGAVADTLTLTDTATAVAVRLGVAADTLTLLDAAAVTAARSGVVSDTLTLVDLAAIPGVIVGTVSDTLSFTDAASAPDIFGYVCINPDNTATYDCIDPAVPTTWTKLH